MRPIAHEGKFLRKAWRGGERRRRHVSHLLQSERGANLRRKRVMHYGAKKRRSVLPEWERMNESDMVRSEGARAVQGKTEGEGW